jgi:hypothetical protein
MHILQRSRSVIVPAPAQVCRVQHLLVFLQVVPGLAVQQFDPPPEQLLLVGVDATAPPPGLETLQVTVLDEWHLLLLEQLGVLQQAMLPAQRPLTGVVEAEFAPVGLLVLQEMAAVCQHLLDVLQFAVVQQVVTPSAHLPPEGLAWT